MKDRFILETTTAAASDYIIAALTELFTIYVLYCRL